MRSIALVLVRMSPSSRLEGDDDLSQEFLTSVKDVGIKVTPILDDTRETTHKLRYRADGKTMLRVNSFSKFDIDEQAQKKVISTFEKMTDELDLVILSDFELRGIANRTGH